MSDITDLIDLIDLDRHKEETAFCVGFLKALEAERRGRGEPDVIYPEDRALMADALKAHRHTRNQLEAA